MEPWRVRNVSQCMPNTTCQHRHRRHTVTTHTTQPEPPAPGATAVQQTDTTRPTLYPASQRGFSSALWFIHPPASTVHLVGLCGGFHFKGQRVCHFWQTLLRPSLTMLITDPSIHLVLFNKQMSRQPTVILTFY